MKISTYDCQFKIIWFNLYFIKHKLSSGKDPGTCIQYGSKTHMKSAHFLSISVHSMNETVNSYTLIYLIMKSVRKLTNSFTCNLQGEPLTNISVDMLLT